MALTQRLEFRQSQSLVMTPQLMQAIKLLQLSNLDLSAFVEEELERNPLLDRASDGPEPPVVGEPPVEGVVYAESGGDGEDGGSDASDMGGGPGEGFEPGQEEYDKARTEFLEEMGYRLIRFTNHDVRYNLAAVVDEIQRTAVSRVAEVKGKK